MQLAGPGSAVGCISIPAHYVHTASETIDVEACVRLLRALLESPFEQ